MTRSGKTVCRLRVKPALAQRRLITARQADQLASLFRILGSETRARLVHALVRADELCVSELAETVRMTPQAVSNQLQRLADRNLVASRRDGTSIYYRLVDRRVAELFERALCLLEDVDEAVHTLTA